MAKQVSRAKNEGYALVEPLGTKGSGVAAIRRIQHETEKLVTKRAVMDCCLILIHPLFSIGQKRQRLTSITCKRPYHRSGPRSNARMGLFVLVCGRLVWQNRKPLEKRTGNKQAWKCLTESSPHPRHPHPPSRRQIHLTFDLWPTQRPYVPNCGPYHRGRLFRRLLLWITCGQSICLCGAVSSSTLLR